MQTCHQLENAGGLVWLLSGMSGLDSLRIDSDAKHSKMDAHSGLKPCLQLSLSWCCHLDLLMVTVSQQKAALQWDGALACVSVCQEHLGAASEH